MTELTTNRGAPSSITCYTGTNRGVMVPVSSTVIPLPVYKMEYGLGFISKDKKAQSSLKPEGGLKLITIKKSQEKKT
ncbi:uncharacterized protein LOC132905647 isoform X2 [Bombus pascuorum]|uniref:uncharacterized protein LOC132905647 isoform X2 n=1 Tax=Bombus pascuorum TaxID=65598 RepID=UPI00298E2801|nr:uncharacterized protein LOC132905647 isoform X2 [Bombus pascuorum]